MYNSCTAVSQKFDVSFEQSDMSENRQVFQNLMVLPGGSTGGGGCVFKLSVVCNMVLTYRRKTLANRRRWLSTSCPSIYLFTLSLVVELLRCTKCAVAQRLGLCLPCFVVHVDVNWTKGEGGSEWERCAVRNSFQSVNPTQPWGTDKHTTTPAG